MRNARSPTRAWEGSGRDTRDELDASGMVIGLVQGRFRTHVGHGLHSFRIPGDENLIGGKIYGIAPTSRQKVDSECAKLDR